MTKSDIDPDVFLSEVFQLLDERIDLREAVTDERLTTIILDALPEKIYFAVKMQSIRDHDLELEEIIGMMKTIFTYPYIHIHIRRYFQHAHFIPIVGVGNRGEC